MRHLVQYQGVIQRAQRDRDPQGTVPTVPESAQHSVQHLSGYQALAEGPVQQDRSIHHFQVAQVPEKPQEVIEKI